VRCSEASIRSRASNVAPFPSRWLEANDVAGACAAACLEFAGELRNDIEPTGSRRGGDRRRKGRLYRVEDPCSGYQSRPPQDRSGIESYKT
jgi:hypothetical protein